jgi:hypothetical protein
MWLPPADDQLGLMAACQNVVGGLIKMVLRLPNGDAVCVDQDATLPKGHFWLPCAPLATDLGITNTAMIRAC